MSRRAGFTLIEVLVSIVLTAVVSLLVYGVVQAARDTGTKLADNRQSLHSALVMRLLLEGALASAQTTFRSADTAFMLENKETPQGVPQDRLTFVTSGDFPPLSPGADWMVKLAPSRQGLLLIGGPIGIRAPSRTLALLPGITGLSVRVRHQALGPDWSEEWGFPAVLPEAVELTYWTDSGPVGVPLTVSLAMGRVH